MPEVDPFLFAEAGSFTSPHAYTVPGAGEVQPYTATATYVNNSGQAILPALRLKSSSGNLLALVFPSTTIANGGSSEVSFVPPFGSAAVSSSTPGATDFFWPAADQADASYDKTTYPNNFLGSGFYDTLVMPLAGGPAFAFAIQGDSDPCLIVTGLPGPGGGIFFGPGNLDPLSSGAYVGITDTHNSGDAAVLIGSQGSTLITGGTDGNSGFTTAEIWNGLRLARCQGSGVRNITVYGGHGVPTIGGNVSDRYLRDDGTVGTNTLEYVCTVAGAAGAATWVGIL